MNGARDTTKTVMISHREGKNGVRLPEAQTHPLYYFHISAFGVGIHPTRHEWTVRHAYSNLAAIFVFVFCFFWGFWLFSILL